MLLSCLRFAAGEPTGHNSRCCIATEKSVRVAIDDLTYRHARFPRPDPVLPFQTTYAASDSILCGLAPLQVVENVIQSAGRGDSLDVRVRVPHFGGAANGVLLVLSMVEKEPSEAFWGVEAMDYEITLSTR